MGCGPRLKPAPIVPVTDTGSEWGCPDCGSRLGECHFKKSFQFSPRLNFLEFRPFMLNASPDIERLTNLVALPQWQILAAVELLDAGNTVPFITRYRKDATGGLNETQLRTIQHALHKLRTLDEKREGIRRVLERRGQLTAELAGLLDGAASLKHLEDLYQPFRYKKTSYVQQARDLGLHPLAEAVYVQGLSASDLEHEVRQAMAPSGQPLEADVVLRGVKALLGEYFSNNLKLKRTLRRVAWKTGSLVCQQIPLETAPPVDAPHPTVAKLPALSVDDGAHNGVASTEIVAAHDDRIDETGDPPMPAPALVAGVEEAAPPKPARRRKKKKRRQDVLFRAYFDFSAPLRQLPPHRVLAINRGERCKQLRVKLQFNEAQLMELIQREVIPATHPLVELMTEAARDWLCRSLLPTLEREIRRELTETAEEHAVRVFSTNLRSLLLQPPTTGQPILAIDPGLKSGCTLAVINDRGLFVVADKISIVGREEKRQLAQQKILDLIQTHGVGLLVIGNGTGCRETEEVVSQVLAGPLAGSAVCYVIVNEAGASVYSTSDAGQLEFPDLEPTVRSAISIGRRLLDPLSELVKINPANIGVGLYQHDVKSKHLESSLTEVVESCVNYVGVDLNTASLDLLQYVAGLNQLTARRIIEQRQTAGPYSSLQQLTEIAGIGPSTFLQCAGFLRIKGGQQPLDATAIHPESYPMAEALLESIGLKPEDVMSLLSSGMTYEDWTQRLGQVNAAAFIAKHGVGEHLMRDLIDSLMRPGRDPREQLPAPIFRKGILQVDDLSVGMALQGQVLNVVDFGIFVDIGIGESGLVHISNLSHDYVRDPHRYFGVGDILDVWVQSIDRKRGRVALTAIDPQSAPPREPRARSGRGRPNSQRGTQSPGTGHSEMGQLGAVPNTQARAAEHASQQRRDNGHRRSDPPHGTRGGPSPPTGRRVREGQTPQSGAGTGRGARNRPRRDAGDASGPAQPRPRTGARRQPAPPVALTEGMVQGTEPLRSFSELLQLVKQNQKPPQDR